MKKNLFVICILLGLLSCNEKKVSLTTYDTYEEGGPIRVVTKGKILMSDSGKTTSYLKLPFIATYQKNDTDIVKADSGVYIEFFDAVGKRSSVLTADKAIMYPNNNMEVFDHVVIKTRDSVVVKTSYMMWYDNEYLARSPMPVDIRKPNERITGVGFESDPKIQNYKMYKVTGSFMLTEGDDY